MYRAIAHSARFDLVHQLNPVDVGVSLALVDVRVPVVLGPYVPDWAASGPGANPLLSAGGLRGKQLLRAMQQRQATTVLLSTPAAESKLEGGAPGRCTCMNCRRASTNESGSQATAATAKTFSS